MHLRHSEAEMGKVSGIHRRECNFKSILSLVPASLYRSADSITRQSRQFDIGQGTESDGKDIATHFSQFVGCASKCILRMRNGLIMGILVGNVIGAFPMMSPVRLPPFEGFSPEGSGQTKH